MPGSDSKRIVRDRSAADMPVDIPHMAAVASTMVRKALQAFIEGDAELAQKFRELALLLRPDLEEELSLVLGDVPAHQVGRFVRATFGWTRKVADTTVHNFAEYLAHERQDLISRNEADQFLRGVDSLREDVDRLAARIDLMKHT